MATVGVKGFTLPRHSRGRVVYIRKQLRRWGYHTCRWAQAIGHRRSSLRKHPAPLKITFRHTD